MITIYSLLKFVHIVAAIGWIGGAFTINLINARIASEKNGVVVAAMTRQSRFYGMAIIGPAAGLTLLAGIVMIAISGLGVPFWIIWGFIAIIASVALGATLLGRASKALQKVASAATLDKARLRAAQRRLMTLNIINVLLLLSAVWAMVFKPAL